MALQLQKTLNNGITADYWRLVRINHCARNGTEVVLGLFLNNEIEDNGILDAVTFTYTIPREVYTSGNCYEWIYEQIKAPILDENNENINIFSDAVDC